jgi:hypothetical protein
MIIDPYNAETGEKIILTDQQKQGIEAVRLIVTAKLKRWHNQPMTEEEIEIAKKIGVSIMSGKGNGKDGLAAMLIIWFMDCFLYPKVPCTSVSDDQLKKVLWSELTKWLMFADAKDRFLLQNDKLSRCDLVGKEKEAIGKRWIAFPKTANPKATDKEKTETLAGFHENYQMIVIDEASGIPEAVFDPLEGTLTGACNFVFMIFNPTRSKGYAIDTQYKHSKYWLHYRWNSEESPLVSQDIIDRIIDKYSKDSNTYRIRVLGLPPQEDESTTIPWDWVEDAMAREIEVNDDDPVIKALDPGAGGDNSIIATRKGNRVYPFERMKSPDSVKLANWAGNNIDAERPDLFRVDTIGIGWAVEGHLREKKGSIIEAADVKRKSSEPEKYFNKRAEMYWRLREKLERGLIELPYDEELKNQLGAIKHKFANKGQIQILDKPTIKKELGHSPDEADALGMLFYDEDKYVSRKIQTDDDYDAVSVTGPGSWML